MTSPTVDIPIPTFTNNNKAMVDARQFYEFLHVDAFAIWLRRRIEHFEFVEGVDYIEKKPNSPNDTKWKTEFLITADMAKQLCMLENTARSREFRKYISDYECVSVNTPTD